MSFAEAPKGMKNIGINTDTVHLMALNDQLNQMVLWATAARSTVQILLAKRAPEPVTPPETVTKPAETPVAPVAVSVRPDAIVKLSKASLLYSATLAGIPEEVSLDKRYLNGRSRPTDKGLLEMQDLITKAKALRAQGEDPSVLWADLGPEPTA